MIAVVINAPTGLTKLAILEGVPVPTPVVVIVVCAPVFGTIKRLAFTVVPAV